MRAEEGMTIVEVVVAGLILVLGALGVLGIVDAASRNSFRAEQSQVVANVLQAEMEKLRGLPYEELALTSAPAHVADPNDPRSRMSTSSFAVLAAGGASELRALVYNGAEADGETVVSGTVDPGPTEFAIGNVSGVVQRFIVWDRCPTSLCADGAYLKRAVVTARLDPTGSGGLARRYQEIQGQFADPGAEPPDNAGPDPGGEVAQPWTVWLTDTTCNHATRQPLAGNHLSHNTRGTCAVGLKTKANCTTLLLITSCPPGAPDLMVESAPPDEADQLYDYAIDVEPATKVDEDIGLTLRKGGGGCNALTSLWGQLPLAAELLDDGVFQKVHKWVSPPIPGGIDLALNGSGTISLWTKTVNESVHPGKICVSLFTRQMSLLNIPIDTPAINLGLADGLFNLNYFTHQEAQWPSQWTEINLPVEFTLNAGLLPGRRLGLAVWVAGSGTGGDGIEFMYDERSFDSRVELEVGQTVTLPIFG